MITFQANQQTLKSAKLLESKARNTYPHLSTSKIRTQLGYDRPAPAFLVYRSALLSRQLYKRRFGQFVQTAQFLYQSKTFSSIFRSALRRTNKPCD